MWTAQSITKERALNKELTIGAREGARHQADTVPSLSSVVWAGNSVTAHFVQQRRAFYAQPCSCAIGAPNYPIGLGQRLQDLRAFGLRKCSHFPRRTAVLAPRSGKRRGVQHCIRGKDHG